MSNILHESIQQQVIGLGRLGWSLRRIEAATGVRRETISGYLKGAGVAVRRRGGQPAQWPPPNPATSAAVSTDSGDAPAAPAASARAPTASACEPYRALIIEGVRRGRNAMAIFQDLVDGHGFAGRYASVRRFVGRLRGTDTPEPSGIITTAPGEEAQVDYGEGPMVRDPTSGKYRRTRLFVLTLGFSRKSVRLLTWRSSSQRWAELHEEAFRRLGGTTRIVVLDNLREGVLQPDVYDAQINPLYRDVLAHYGVVALPCRVRDPDRKGKVESGIGHTQKTPLRGMRFETMEAAQAYLDQWDARWADTRIHGTTKRQVSAMFAEERPHLGALPLEPFRYYRYGMRSVHLDGCVEVEAAYYSVPPGWISQRVAVQWNDLHVRVLDPRTGQLLREHLGTRRGHHRVADADRPSRTPTKTLALLDVARRAGTSIGAVCDAIHRTEGVLAPRRILGVLALARKHGPALTEDAAHFALEAGAPSYRFLRRYLERVKVPATALKQIDPLIRQLTLYRDLIDRQGTAHEPR